MATQETLEPSPLMDTAESTGNTEKFPLKEIQKQAEGVLHMEQIRKK